MANGRASLIGVVVGMSVIGLATVAPAEPPIRIGATLSRTGVYASLGANQLRGYQLCVKHTNEHGGALGRKLDLVVYDDDRIPRRPPASMKGSSRRTRWTWCSARTAVLSPKPPHA